MPQAIIAAVVKVAVKAVVNYYADAYADQKAWRNAIKYKLKYGNVGRADAEYTGAIEPRRRLYGDFRAAGLNVLPAIVTSPTMARLASCIALVEVRE